MMMTRVIVGSLTICLHEDVDVVTILEGPLVKDDIDAIVHEPFAEAADPVGMFLARPAIGDENSGVG